MTRRLVREEGILAGGSGGMVVAGALRAAVRHADRLVVVHLPDGGRNYLSKIFNDDWMRERGFEEGL
jgi:cystathionine beta-synthase